MMETNNGTDAFELPPRKSGQPDPAELMVYLRVYKDTFQAQQPDWPPDADVEANVFACITRALRNSR